MSLNPLFIQQSHIKYHCFSATKALQAASKLLKQNHRVSHPKTQNVCSIQNSVKLCASLRVTLWFTSHLYTQASLRIVRLKTIRVSPNTHLCVLCGLISACSAVKNNPSLTKHAPLRSLRFNLCALCG